MATNTNQYDVKHFLVKSSDLSRSKLFVEFYQPKYQALLDRLNQSPYTLRSLKQLCVRLFDGPFGSNRKVDMYQESGIPYIRVKDVLPSGIKLDELTYISEEKHKELSRSRVVPKNVLITIAGRLGTAAVFPDILKEENITGHIAGIEFPEEINPYYIAAFINSQFGEFQVTRLGHRTTRPEVSLSEAGKILVPVPPRPIQDYIAQVMQNAYVAQKKKLAELAALLNKIDVCVFESLGISPESVIEEQLFLKHISQIKGGRFDVGFNMGFHKFDPYRKSVLPVKDIALFPKETKKLSSQPQVPFRYIDISSIDVHLGEIDKAEEIMGADAPSRARQVVHTGDIIVSTVRPTRRAIALVPEVMDGFICSTGFTIVHATDKVIPEYLHIALRLSTTLEQFGRRSAGSSYPAILENDIKETLIPVPDKEVQKEIAVEATKYRNEAKSLRIQAETIVSEAKACVERMILGEEEVA